MANGVVGPVFAGRGAELTLLAGAFEVAVGGMPGTVLLGAEAGGGKSRLVGEFTEAVRDRALVLAGGCGSWAPEACPMRRSPRRCGCGSPP